MKRCADCFEPIPEDGDLMKATLNHWLEEHPRHDTLLDVLNSTWVRVDCRDCGQRFFSPVNYGGDGAPIAADAYCPDCDGEGIRRIMAQELTVPELLAREVDPAADDLDNRRFIDA